MAVHDGGHLWPTINPRYRPWLHIVVIVLAGLLALAVAAWLASPRIRILRDDNDVASVLLAGIGARVKSAEFVTARGVVPLRVQSGGLAPADRLSAGVSGYMTLKLVGPSTIRWLPWENRVVRVSLRTPMRPLIRTRRVTTGIRARLTVTFNEPIEAVRYAVAGSSPHILTLSSLRKSVTLPLALAKPAQYRLVRVAARARRWEAWGPTMVVRWASVPYVTASPLHTAVSPTGALVVRFSVPLRTAHLAHWVLLPHESGIWHETSATQYQFTPFAGTGYGPGALVQVKIPGGREGPIAQSGSMLKMSQVLQWKTPEGSVLRLQELLALEGYLPVAWTPSSPVTDLTLSYANATIYHPPSGHFTWKYPNLPAVLDTLWSPGEMTVVTQGAIMQFEAENGLPINGVPGPQLWSALIRDYLAGKTDPAPYTYISVTEDLPETLELWSDNHLVLTTDANTGIPATPTYLGTFPIYDRLPFQIMRGRNPDGVPYADPVHWIDYFEGGDAVHGFARAAYGFRQSLGCVEVPLNVAPTIYNTVNYGTLVTVNPVGIAPASASPRTSGGS
ncbi:MAG: murein L,D-transpeptidase [Sulfobacillus acidophilus]|uniref:Murein L,D-transpeptidase n=1 Tax=Sulfobacillus acidophilus TaxID=53633 RepID=A0A2T2WKJ1_9FIRM|nr:MAG: murein L,D-transpeptidase [Sulfobacillus acidophilus]